MFRTSSAAVVIAAVSVLGASPASADVCFTGFSGTVHYQFAGTLAGFKTLGQRAAPGVIFGSLSSCAGLTHWPLVGAESVKSTSIVLGFRAMTVDASGCGAVDYIVSLDPVKLTGTMQLHNDRNNFSNSTALQPATCATVPALALSAPGVSDAAGNSAK